MRNDLIARSDLRDLMQWTGVLIGFEMFLILTKPQAGFIFDSRQAKWIEFTLFPFQYIKDKIIALQLLGCSITFEPV